MKQKEIKEVFKLAKQIGITIVYINYIDPYPSDSMVIYTTKSKLSKIELKRAVDLIEYDYSYQEYSNRLCEEDIWRDNNFWLKYQGNPINILDDEDYYNIEKEYFNLVYTTLGEFKSKVRNDKIDRLLK